MDSTIWPLGFAAANVTLAYVVFFRTKKRDESSEANASMDRVRVETLDRVDRTLEAVSSDLAAISKTLESMQRDITDLKVAVAIHDDRFKRPLRAVAEE